MMGFSCGARSYDNNFQLDGISVSDVQGSAAGSGGIPIPNPDSIQEFKVQTGLYDAAYGRYAGANVSLITKAGSNAFHGTVFEFFRNEILNANDFLLNQTDQPRPVLKQNQFGFAFGGPIKKEKLFFSVRIRGRVRLTGSPRDSPGRLAPLACMSRLRRMIVQPLLSESCLAARRGRGGNGCRIGRVQYQSCGVGAVESQVSRRLFPDSNATNRGPNEATFPAGLLSFH
jgi:hypothetical protein